MTKAELIERVHGKKHIPRGLTKKAVAQIVDAVFLEMGDYFIRTKVTRNAIAKLTYPGFGTFSKRRRGERTVRNPQTGDPIVIPAQSTITFSPRFWVRVFPTTLFQSLPARPIRSTILETIPFTPGDATAVRMRSSMRSTRGRGSRRCR